jgi:PAS domain S-box-containing protein
MYSVFEEMNVDSIISLLSALGFGLTALYVAIARRQRPTWKTGVVLLLSCTEFTLAHALQGIVADFAARVFWYKMCLLGIVVAPTAFLWLALHYSGWVHKLTWRTLPIVGVFPAINASLVITNESHGLVWKPASTAVIVNSETFISPTDANIWYWIFVAYSYLLMGLGCFFFIQLFVRSRGLYGWQVVAVVLAALLSVSGTVMDFLGLSPLPPFSATAIGLAVGCITVAFFLPTLQRRDLLFISRRRIIDSISDGIVVVDADNRIVDMNPAAEQLIGVRTSQAIGMSLEPLLPRSKSASAGNVAGGNEVTLKSGDSERVFDLRISTIQDWRGRVAGRSIGMHDITNLKLAEEQIRKLNEELELRVVERTNQLEVANKELEAFAYSVAHDLRAPLRAIDGFTHILVEEYGQHLDSEGKRICNVIFNETQHMGRVIDDLLAFSQISHREMELMPINMEELAKSAFYQLTTPANRGRIDFRLAPLPAAISDLTLMREVWTNLLSNAIKFSSKVDRAVVEVGFQQENDWTVYWVRDNGAGFDMRYAEKLFTVFWRLHSDKEFEGTGVGLAVVQRLIHRHGGKVWAEGEVDKGATFYFTLPRKRVRH